MLQKEVSREWCQRGTEDRKQWHRNLERKIKRGLISSQLPFTYSEWTTQRFQQMGHMIYLSPRSHLCESQAPPGVLESELEQPRKQRSSIQTTKMADAYDKGIDSGKLTSNASPSAEF